MDVKESLVARARCKITHDVAYDYDEKRGIWLRLRDFEDEFYNLILDGGRVAIHTYVYGTSAQRVSEGLSGTGLNYIALTNNAAAPAAGDTTLAGELSGNGLTRAQGTVTLPTGSGNVTTVSHQFTYLGVPAQGVQKTALFDAAAAGKMAHEILFAQRTLNTNDTLTVTFQITLA